MYAYYIILHYIIIYAGAMRAHSFAGSCTCMYVRACQRTCVRTHVRTRVRACEGAHVPVCEFVGFCMCARVYVRLRARMGLHMCL